MVYLIDFENVHEEGFSALGRLGEKDAVYCFFTKNVAKISMSALAGMRSGQLHFVEAESGKQSLDLVLVSYLGYLIGTKPQELYYDIVSNDNGFTKVADFWNKRGNGLRVRVRKTIDLRQKVEPVKALPQPGTNANMNGGMNTNRPRRVQTQRPADKAAAGNDEITAEQKPAAENVTATAENAAVSASEKIPETQQKPAARPLDPSASAALEAAGISSEAIEFIRAEAEKYRNDKNMKQLVYRSVVKKFGQKKGTQIYNNTKKLLLK